MVGGRRKAVPAVDRFNGLGYVRGRAIWWSKSEINCDMRRKKNGLRKRGARFCWLGMTVSPGRSRRWLLRMDAVIQDLFLVDAASDQGGNAQAVDLAGEAAGVLEDAFDGIVAERGTRDVPGDAQVVLDVLENVSLRRTTAA